MIVRLPDPNVTVIVLSNNDSVPAAPAPWRATSSRSTTASRTPLPAPRTVAKVDPTIFDQYVGKYELRPDFIMTVTREGNSLITQATGQQDRDLPGVGDHVLSQADGSNDRVREGRVREGGGAGTDAGRPGQRAKKIE